MTDNKGANAISSTASYGGFKVRSEIDTTMVSEGGRQYVRGMANPKDLKVKEGIIDLSKEDVTALHRRNDCPVAGQPRGTYCKMDKRVVHITCLDLTTTIGRCRLFTHMRRKRTQLGTRQPYSCGRCRKKAAQHYCDWVAVNDDVPLVERSTGYCHRFLTRNDLDAIAWLDDVVLAKPTQFRVKIVRHGRMIHVVLDPNGIPAARAIHVALDWQRKCGKPLLVGHAPAQRTWVDVVNTTSSLSQMNAETPTVDEFLAWRERTQALLAEADLLMGEVAQETPTHDEPCPTVAPVTLDNDIIVTMTASAITVCEHITNGCDVLKSNLKLFGASILEVASEWNSTMMAAPVVKAKPKTNHPPPRVKKHHKRRRNKLGHRTDRLPPWLWHKAKTEPIRVVVGAKDPSISAMSDEDVLVEASEIILSKAVATVQREVSSGKPSPTILKQASEQIMVAAKVLEVDGKSDPQPNPVERKLIRRVYGGESPTLSTLMHYYGNVVDTRVRVHIISAAELMQTPLPDRGLATAIMDQAQPPDGWCYLAGLDGVYRLIVASVFGYRPDSAELACSTLLSVLRDVGVTKRVKTTIRREARQVVAHVERSDDGTELLSALQSLADVRKGLGSIPVGSSDDEDDELMEVRRPQPVHSWMGTAALTFLSAATTTSILHAAAHTAVSMRPDWCDKCYKFLISCDIGSAPALRDVVACPFNPLFPDDHYTVTFDGSRVHLSPSSEGLSPGRIYNMLVQRTLQLKGSTIQLEDATIVGSMTPQDPPDLDWVPIVAIGVGITTFIAGWIPATCGALITCRPDWFGHCYCHISPLLLGVNPLITNFVRLRNERNTPIRNTRLRVTFKHNIVHLSPAQGGAPAIVVFHQLARGVITDSEGVRHELNEASRIGGQRTRAPRDIRLQTVSTIAVGAVYLATAAFTVSLASVWVAAQREMASYIGWFSNLRRNLKSRCYQLITTIECGSQPLLTDFIMASQGLPCEPNRVSASVAGNIIHIFTDGKGMPAAEMRKYLQDGVVPTRDGFYQADPRTRIGGVPMNVWHHRVIVAIALTPLFCALLVLAVNTSWLLLALLVIQLIIFTARVWDPPEEPLSIRFATVGTRGDRISPEGCCQYLATNGLDAEVVNLTPGFAADLLLQQAEQGAFVIPTAILAVAQAKVDTLTRDHSLVLVPHVTSIRGHATFSVTADPDTIKGFNYGAQPGTWLYWIISCLYRMCKADVAFDSRKGCCPRYSYAAGKLTPVRCKPNTGTRGTLVCTGSSIMDEPADLPLETTWSTHPGSIYQHEPRTNHLDFMHEYSKVICHGGAGTVDTARASGCEVISISTALDRDIIEPDNRDYTGDEASIFVRLAELVDLRHTPALAACYPWLQADWRTTIEFVLAVYYRVLRAIRFVTIAFLLAGSHLGYDFFMANGLTTTMAKLMESPMIPMWLGTVFSEWFMTLIMIGYREGWLLGLIWDHKHHMWEVMWFIIEYRFASPLLLVKRYTGWLGAVLYAAWSLYGAKRAIPGLSHTTEVTYRVINQLKLQFRCHGKTLDKNVLYFRLQPLCARWVPWWLPLYHVDYYNPALDQSVGVSCQDAKCVVLVDPAPKPAIGEIVWATTITTDRWNNIVESMLEHHGKPYHPLSNCQTAAARVLGSEIKLKGDAAPELQEHELRFVIGTLICITAWVMTAAGLSTMCLGFFAAFIGVPMSVTIQKMAPYIAFAGVMPDLGGFKGLMNFLAGPSVTLVDGPTVVTDVNKYPIAHRTWSALSPSSTRLMRINVGGKVDMYLPPLQGVNRPNYEYGRDDSYTRIHGISDSGANTGMTIAQMAAVDQLQRLAANMDIKSGVVAVIATTKERPVSPKVWDFVKRHCDDWVLITNDDQGEKSIRLDVSGREAATLRLCMPTIPGVTWLSLNAAYDSQALRALGKVRCLIKALPKMVESMPVSFTSHGLNPGAAGYVAYQNPLMSQESIDFDIYGCEEWEMTKTPMRVFVERNWIMFNCVRKEQDFPCTRRIVIYDGNTLQDMAEFDITNWDIGSLLAGMETASKPGRKTVGLNSDGLLVNESPIQMAPVISDMYADGATIEEVAADITANAGQFATKVSRFATEQLKGMKKYPLVEETIAAYYRVVSVFSRTGRPPKGIWAPVLRELKPGRSEELTIAIHPNPRFIMADFNDTLSHYVKHLNMTHGTPGQQLSPTVYRRRVNRSPYVDTWLKERLPDAFEAGIDASVIACKEVMLGSLARYNKGGFADALTDKDISEIATAIYRQNPDMLSDAHIADPIKLTKKFLSYKKYSAGLPFNYEGSGLVKRSDLRRAGWLKPIAELGLDPYRTGKWYPAISHAFPKSQVVKKAKIEANPAKMRSIVATAGFINVQQGILNFDINNRHDYMGSHEKVAMPLTGTHMNYIFDDLSHYNYVYSLDATNMDANISDGVFRVIGELRKKGFEGHPAYEAICKHIDCAIEQTKYSYVVNLVSDSVNDTPNPLERDLGEWAAGFDYEGIVNHPVAPGGILHKKHGGSTGDSNVTFNNTKALPIIVMYAYCKAGGIPYADFFDQVGLHNFGDDDVLGCDRNPYFMNKVVRIAQRELGIQLRFEAQGTDVLSQVFLGRRPRPAEEFAQDFNDAGIRMPKYAIINDGETMRMRLAREKAEMTRHKGIRHELYRLEKAIGYANLCAHQQELYADVRDYFEEVKTRLPGHVKSAGWFKRQYKLPPYIEVLRRWYKPVSIQDFGVHKLQMEVGIAVQTEKAFLRCLRFIGGLADAFPSHLVAADHTTAAYRVTELHTGIFEAHAWHQFVKEFGEPPTLRQLESRVQASPYSQYTNCDAWLRSYGRDLPTEGALFERNLNHAIWRVIIFTAIYTNLHHGSVLLDRMPGGNVVMEILNLTLFKSRRLFGTLGYMHYIAKAKGAPTIDALAPKDPYTYHKRMAALIANTIPKFGVLGYIPIGKLGDWTAATCDKIAETTNLTVTESSGAENIPDNSPWRSAYNLALGYINHGGCPVLVAHTGTGKTQNLPPLALYDRERQWDAVIVVMPRNIICEQWTKKSGAQFKKRGVKPKGRFFCCTYGYLAHCYANSNQWWPPDSLFMFDEAHEESLEWRYLRKRFVVNHSCMALTATPASQTCINFHVISVDVEPKYRIDAHNARSLEQAITSFCPTARRFLVIEPSLRRCRQISERLTASGYPNKVVHSGDREIPDGVHIVATSVIEASVTIPGCDLVIDTGERLVTDGSGGLLRVPNDIPGSIQRRGRTGRTNDGTYVSVVQPKNHIYEPLPEVTMVLQDHPVTAGLTYTIPFDKAPDRCRLVGDNYAHWHMKRDERDANSVGFVHLLMQVYGNDMDKAEHIYRGCAKGRIPDSISHHADTFDLADLMPAHEAFKLYANNPVVYYTASRPSGSRVKFLKYKLVADYEPSPREGNVQKGQLDTGRATPGKDGRRKRQSNLRQVNNPRGRAEHPKSAGQPLKVNTSAHP